jgi:hypothetical protein
MKAVGDLRSGRSSLPRTLGICSCAITRDDLDSRMRPQPLGQSIGRATRQQRDRIAALQIDQYGAIALAFAQREVIDTKDCRSRTRRQRQPPEQAQQRVTAQARVPPATKAYCGRASQSHAQSNEALGQPQRAPRPRGRYRR